MTSRLAPDDARQIEEITRCLQIIALSLSVIAQGLLPEKDKGPFVQGVKDLTGKV